jgi:hypothetical protein
MVFMMSLPELVMILMFKRKSRKFSPWQTGGGTFREKRDKSQYSHLLFSMELREEANKR